MLLEFMDLAQQCAPTVAPQTMAALVQVESGFNPYAIGVVDGRLARQPVNLEEAVATAQQLEAGGWNFSLGIAQVNRHNLPKYKLTYAQAFDACANLRAGSKILQDCYARASAKLASEKDPLHAASVIFRAASGPTRRGSRATCRRYSRAPGWCRRRYRSCRRSARARRRTPAFRPLSRRSQAMQLQSAEAVGAAPAAYRAGG
ncbi:lytic transglycosylase domain-containing protein [Xanthomonas phaseoli]|uniref:lytic transglycosylase domain-containing protein n=1 Tax=Xanthomonas phaseoli TaxID=1985254 RepID=UPI0002EB5EC0|nr:lytic transglycosylase domain-containing protein [Xanthomonas phaseoli]